MFDCAGTLSNLKDLDCPSLYVYGKIKCTRKQTMQTPRDAKCTEFCRPWYKMHLCMLSKATDPCCNVKSMLVATTCERFYRRHCDADSEALHCLLQP